MLVAWGLVFLMNLSWQIWRITVGCHQSQSPDGESAFSLEFRCEVAPGERMVGDGRQGRVLEARYRTPRMGNVNKDDTDFLVC